MQVQRKCFNEFPDQCAGCPEYRESRQDPSPELILMTGMGIIFPSKLARTVKECKIFHKRIVEYQE